MQIRISRSVCRILLILAIFAGLFCIQITQPSSVPTAHAAPVSFNTLAQRPLRGWSTWSLSGGNDPNYGWNWFNAASFKAQADAMKTKLASHGYEYINIDGGWWDSNTVDAYGRAGVNASAFPGGIQDVINYVHNDGLKFGIYLTRGLFRTAFAQNTPIQNTSYHARDIAALDSSGNPIIVNTYAADWYVIDWSKPGAQEYINSWATLLASWGVDYVKLDFLDNNTTNDVRAWSSAIQQSGRAMYLDLSFPFDNTVSHVSTWRQYANSWRIDGDVECYCNSTLTSWPKVSSRFNDAPAWATWAGPGGWNNLDSLDIGNGASTDGLSNDERQTAATLWAISSAPFSTGSDLTKLDQVGLGLLTNDEALAIDAAGIPATPLSTSSRQQVWRSFQTDGSYVVALFNLDDTSSAPVTVNWTELGITGSATVRNVWTQSNLGSFTNGYSATLNSHASLLLRVTPATTVATRTYEAEAPNNTLSDGAHVAACSNCSGGQKVGYIGPVGSGGGSLTFNGVNASTGGNQTLIINYLTGEDRSASISVNGNAGSIINFNSVGNWATPGTLGMLVNFNAGNNTIKISYDAGWSPDIDSIRIVSTSYTIYEAEASSNTLSGGAHVVACGNCSGGQKVGYIGPVGSGGGSLTFNGVNASVAGNQTLIINYISGENRSVFISVNGNTGTQVNFNSTGDWNTVGHLSMTVNLNAGSNTIKIYNDTGWGPDIDSIALS